MTDEFGATRKYLAEHLLGWKWELVSPEEDHPIAGWAWTSTEEILIQFPYENSVPDWLGTWEGAGAVLGAMRELGWEWDIGTDQVSEGPYYALFTHHKPEGMASANGQNPRDAVALAAEVALKGAG